MKKVRVTGLPRQGDPEEQRKLWFGMELTVIEPDDPLYREDRYYLWVDYEEVIAQLEVLDPAYADFFRKLRATPGGSDAPGLLLEKCHCQLISG